MHHSSLNNNFFNSGSHPSQEWGKCTSILQSLNPHFVAFLVSLQHDNLIGQDCSSVSLITAFIKYGPAGKQLLLTLHLTKTVLNSRVCEQKAVDVKCTSPMKAGVFHRRLEQCNTRGGLHCSHGFGRLFPVCLPFHALWDVWSRITSTLLTTESIYCTSWKSVLSSSFLFQVRWQHWTQWI